MLIKSLVIKKDYLTTVNEKATLAEALKVLEDSGYRCVPIVDDTGTIFRGNIYKMHIYRHKSQGGDMNLPVTYLLKNATKTIKVNSPFFKVFFNIKDLPYIAVLDEDNHFYGILIYLYKEIGGHHNEPHIHIKYNEYENTLSNAWLRI